MGIENEIVTINDIENLFRVTSEKVLNRSINEKIINTVEKTQIRTGKLLKFYQFKDKAKVQLDDDSVMMCKVLHRCADSITDFHTPLGEEGFDEAEKERCIIPFAEINCLCADVNSEDNEGLLLGYFLNRDLFVTEPAQAGEYKLKNVGLGTTNESISLGVDSAQYYTKEEIDEKIKAIWEAIEKKEEENE